MAQVIISENLEKEINKKFKNESIKVINEIKFVLKNIGGEGF